MLGLRRAPELQDAAGAAGRRAGAGELHQRRRRCRGKRAEAEGGGALSGGRGGCGGESGSGMVGAFGGTGGCVLNPEF